MIYIHIVIVNILKIFFNNTTIYTILYVCLLKSIILKNTKFAYNICDSTLIIIYLYVINI